MARTAYEGRTRVYWCTTIDDISAPTEGEIAAGTDLSSFVTKDGVNPGLSTNNVDTAALDETFDAQVPGSYGANFQLTMFRDDDADDAWDLCVYGTEGFLVIWYFATPGDNTPPAAGDVVEVWPAIMHQPVMQQSAANEAKKFVETFAIPSAPDQNAIVASGT